MKISTGKESPYHLLLKGGDSDALAKFESQRMSLFRGDSIDDLIDGIDKILAPHGMEALVHLSELSDNAMVEAVVIS